MGHTSQSEDRESSNQPNGTEPTQQNGKSSPEVGGDSHAHVNGESCAQVNGESSAKFGDVPEIGGELPPQQGTAGTQSTPNIVYNFSKSA